MKTFLITYDLKKVGQNYSELYNAIKSLGDWQHPMESVWLVAVDSQFVFANDLYDKVKETIDENDSLFVVDITSQDRQGWMPKSLWEWLKNVN